jgi:hypothetical protein
MQIHEITRRNINEGPLKNVATTPVNFGRTTAAMPQQSVAPSKVSFAPNMMPKAAPAVVPALGNNLAVVPKSNSVANTAGNGITTTSVAAPTTPTGQLAPAANRVQPGQSDPNVIDVAAKDITNRRALPAAAAQVAPALPAPAPTGNYDINTGAPISDKGRATAASQAAFATSPKGKALQAKYDQWDAEDAAAKLPAAAPAAAPVAQSAPANNFKTIKGAQTPVAKAPGKAGFVRNAAEYFANKTLNAAGIPVDQQGQYHPGGHMAALQGTGIASIAKAENDIATEISKQWAQLGIINNVKDEKLDPNNIVQAAQDLNTRKLQLNTNNIVANVKKMAPEYRRLGNLYKKPAVRPPAPAAEPLSFEKSRDRINPNDPDTARLMAMLKSQGKL